MEVPLVEKLLQPHPGALDLDARSARRRLRPLLAELGERHEHAERAVREPVAFVSELGRVQLLLQWPERRDDLLRALLQRERPPLEWLRDEQEPQRVGDVLLDEAPAAALGGFQQPPQELEEALPLGEEPELSQRPGLLVRGPGRQLEVRPQRRSWPARHHALLLADELAAVLLQLAVQEEHEVSRLVAVQLQVVCRKAKSSPS
ncbi:hypothetical protein [Mumia zhuanghuii]|uniref:Uncharacterized protein n=1 Tax=Mumia zhuanghuii TaxID=2585211 RepID=A0A5C4M579_9ACTN|nr:hypothetical protein [Mumia zhuanghuii]TNC28415.1 hypothetical protein FHE65_33890 [Mumia zhuanghuii]